MQLVYLHESITNFVKVFVIRAQGGATGVICTQSDSLMAGGRYLQSGV